MDTKTRILTGAGELFFKYGIRSITMDDIAKHLGMSKKTIYQFFEDKDQIVISLSKMNLTMHQNTFEAIEKSSKDPVHEIVNAAEQMRMVFSRINPVIFSDMQKYHPKAWADFKEFKEKCLSGMIEENLQRGIKAGLYRENIDVKVLAKLRLEQVEMAMNLEMFPPDKYNMSKVQYELLDHFLHGICTLKGHKLLNKYQQITEEE